MDPVPASVLDRYSVGNRLAAGAAGTVVAAVDTTTGEPVVVKFFDGADDNFAAWVAEVRLAMRLRHANIPRCLDAGHDAGWGLSVLVFERAAGGSLRRALASGRRFAADEARRVLGDVAAALAHAHGHGVIHRDVKPENILSRTALGEPPWLLTDFGAGRFLPRGAVARAPAGSFAYMAPEVMLGGATAESDQYSLGVVGAELCSGAALDRRARSQFRLDHVDGDALARAIVRLLDPDPARRFPTVEAAGLALAGAGRFDVTAIRDGSAFVLVDDAVFVRRPDDPALAQVGHVAGARRFVNAWGDAHAIVLADRLVAFDPYGRTLGPAPDAPVFVADARPHAAWTLEPAGVALRAAHRAVTRVDAALPAEWRAGGRPLGVSVGPGRALLGVRGSAVVAHASVADGAPRLTLEGLPGPLHDVRRVGGHAVVLCGDADRGAALALDAGLRLLAAVDRPVDTLRIDLIRDTPSVTTLAPDLVRVVEEKP